MSDHPIRAFLALEIPDQVKAQLASAQGEIRHELPKARWTRVQGWHLTLKFLGEVERPVLTVLGAELRSRIGGVGALTVKLEKTGFFPSSMRPRVAWVGGTADGVEEVVAEVEEAAELAGFPRDRRPWSVHLTQARLKTQWPKAAVDRFFAWGDTLDLEAFTCREVVLFSSDLQPGGAVYTALERFSLE
ncbi:MAG: RNA 2',3'-cyclic phosphodiesterase [Thermoanaerobaculales bacterium]|nr:RNA 2',3'-cyclic phosphodiesterase [Thermoanaerobaculales bacterium]